MSTLIVLLISSLSIWGEDSYQESKYQLQSAFDGSYGFPAPNFGTPKADIFSERFNTGWDIGILGIQPRSPLLEPSPYISGYWDTKSPKSSKNHWRFVLKGGAILMNSRMFNDSAIEAPPEPLLQETRGELETAGADPKTIGYLDIFYYNNKAHFGAVLFGSLKAEFARAFKLVGPFDVAFGATALLDMFTGRAEKYPVIPYPNLQTDETVALRYKPRNSPLAAGLFVGDSQNFSPLPDDIFWRLVETKVRTGKDPRLGLDVTNAPHIGVGVWGHLPIGVENSFQAQYLFQKNPTTNKHKVLTQFNPSIVDLRFLYEREDGPEILFQALKFGVGVRPLPWLSVGIDTNFENGHFGEAGYDNRSLMFGLSGAWERHNIRSHTQASVKGYPQDSYYDHSPAVYNVGGPFNDLIKEIGSNNPIYKLFLMPDNEARRELIETLCPSDGGERPFPQLCQWVEMNLPLVDGTMAVMNDDRKFRALVLRFAKYTFLKETSKQGYSSNDLAAASAIANARLSPIFPLREQDREIFKKWLVNQMGPSLNLKRHEDGTPVTQEEVINALLDLLPPKDANYLKEVYGDDIQQFGDKVFDYVFELAKREINKIILEWKRVTEELQGLRASGGLNAAETSRNAIIQAFEKDNKDRLQDVMKAPDTGFNF